MKTTFKNYAHLFHAVLPMVVVMALGVFAVTLSPSVTEAQPNLIINSGSLNGHLNGGPLNGGGLVNPLAFDTLPEFLQAILQAVILIVFPIIVLFMVYSGFKFIAAQGKPEEIAKARKTFVWTLIGALLILGAQALSIAIDNTIKAISTP